MLHQAWNSKGEMPYCFPRSSIKFQGHMGQNITDFDPNWAFPDYRPVATFKSLRFALFSCDQAAIWLVQSVRLSVRPSHLFHHVPIIISSWNFQELLPMTKCKRSRSEVITQLNLFRTVTPVWIHIWWWNDAYSLMMLRRGALLFFKVICKISRSHGSKKRWIWPRLGVSGL